MTKLAKNSKVPAGYEAPLRKRSDMLAEIRRLVEDRYYNRGYPICFNVKLYRTPEITFRLLFETYKRQEGIDEPIDLDWLRERREEFDVAKSEDFVTLTEWALENMRSLVTDSDCFNHLWDGTSLGDVEWVFEGRSGGWLCLYTIFGQRVDGMTLDELNETLTYDELRLLYRFIVQCAHDFREEAINDEFVYQMAWAFFHRADEHPRIAQSNFSFMEEEINAILAGTEEE